MLVIPEPKPLITVVVGKVERASSVLLVLEPFALILLPVGEEIDTLAHDACLSHIRQCVCHHWETWWFHVHKAYP